MRKIDIPKNSELEKIKSYAFICTDIYSIFIPQKVISIEERSFFFNRSFILEIDENSQLKMLKAHAFYYCNDVVVMVPINLKDILTIS